MREPHASPAFDHDMQRIIDAFVAAEERQLAAADNDRECDCKGGMFPARAPASRRVS